LHAALADFPGELAPLSGIRDWLAQLSPSAELTRQLEALTPVVFESSLAAQALHGDVSIGNLLRTDSGPLWNDLEDVCTGPVEWDVAGLVASVRARGHGEAFIAALLDAYGQVEDLAPFLEAHALYETIWRAFDGG
jgi:Ser/Thr protein kinase RdoA (MazF antagonist)